MAPSSLSALTPTPLATIRDIEQIITTALEELRPAPLSEKITAAFPYLLPPGMKLRVELHEDGRKKRSNAAASNWTHETGEIVLYFERPEVIPVSQQEAIMPVSRESEKHSAPLLPRPLNAASPRPTVVPSTDLQAISSLQIQQCCEALAEEEKAGKAFIALKWFRDNALTERGYQWADSVTVRQAVLAKAIEVGALSASTIPNPKTPQHPTTTVKLNRESKYAESIAPRFQPLRAKGGASASEILLHDRGRP